ncbi:glutamate formimidoyltransferase [candidate division KSB1 bacterium]|nr:glutamate formimidoyltransferase [candidate division KSB1 bacterium]
MLPRKLVECVPNFSEGRNQLIIDAIAKTIQSVQGVWLLHVDSNADANRTVMTFVGSPDAVMVAAFQAISRAAELIDMRHHTGTHARIGATDVCPFVPIAGISMSETILLATALAEKVGKGLDIPVYLYEHAAIAPHKRNLADLRAGEYEGLREKMRRLEWKSDFGPSFFQPRVGATVIGVRSFLIAYNVNLASTNIAIARRIAGMIRESGIPQRNPDGSLQYDENNNAIRTTGEFKSVKAVGWWMPRFNCTQVSMNLTDFLQSPPHLVYERISSLALTMGTRVTGSEIVGLVPEKALLLAGDYYLKKEKQGADPILAAIKGLGLNDLYAFQPLEKILEYRLAAVMQEQSRDNNDKP